MTTASDARSRLILALDVPDRSAAMSRVRALCGHVGYFKVGLEIFVREGPRIVEEIAGLGERVFLDLKLHDIPNTVAGAVRSACRLGVHMLTIHASGGSEMMKAARSAADSSPSPPLLLAVTALTSISPGEAGLIGVQAPLNLWVQNLAELAHRSGIQGVVASPLELPDLRNRFGNRLRTVIPGIRPAGTASDDQARMATPANAIRWGADFLVVGRPILQAPEPAEAADRIVAEIASALDSL